MKIKYFSWIKDITKQENEGLNIDNINSIKNLKDFLIEKYPELKKHLDQNIIRIAVNNEYVIDDIPISNNDEIAIFPPVSGG
tara:strand:- start:307 stop:552 length:246 start_codon:yes stop_codon:yes gene_type:complete